MTLFSMAPDQCLILAVGFNDGKTTDNDELLMLRRDNQRMATALRTFQRTAALRGCSVCRRLGVARSASVPVGQRSQEYGIANYYTTAICTADDGGTRNVRRYSRRSAFDFDGMWQDVTFSVQNVEFYRFR